MTPEELLIPRYKIIARFPRGFLPVGTVFMLDNESVIATLPDGKKETGSSYYYSEPDDFPGIFRRLQWWEERKKTDMPRYLKWINTGVCTEVVKYRLDNDCFFTEDEKDFPYSLRHVVPINQEEYNIYQRSLTK